MTNHEPPRTPRTVALLLVPLASTKPTLKDTNHAKFGVLATEDDDQ